jgi:hypothetical protein
MSVQRASLEHGGALGPAHEGETVVRRAGMRHAHVVRDGTGLGDL